MRKVIRRKIVSLPNLDTEIDLKEIPELSGRDYSDRVRRARSRMGPYTHLVIYGDREHFSNIEYFTGFDPRFEEALLVIPHDGTPTIIVGNEGADYCNIIDYEIRKYIYPPFSLPGQPRALGRPFESILRLAGLNEASRVGLVGWKLFTQEDHSHPAQMFDFPHFIIECLLKVLPLGGMHNATEVMTGLEAGLRITLEPKELLLNEIAGTLSSRNTYRVLENLREGMTEIEASTSLNINGMPISVHPNINFGKNLAYGLASPQAGSRLRQGDAIGLGMAYRRSLCHKIGYYIDGPEEEPEARRAFYDKYFRTLAAWYEAVSIGVSGGRVYEATAAEAGGLSEFGVALNPGHLIHTDEWTNTPFRPGCSALLRSGMTIQCDFTAAKPEEDLFAHAEDGIVLADESTREELKAASPAAWQRIQERREFMTHILNIRLSEDVLPVSDLPGVVFPYMRDPETVLAFE